MYPVYPIVFFLTITMLAIPTLESRQYCDPIPPAPGRWGHLLQQAPKESLTTINTANSNDHKILSPVGFPVTAIKA
ncbi:hypothetical protein CPB86DRAFT_532219 [Serendipita vermifera]|nr:hypothetical protein CPB86DRAFT_532219 [Serendipita vermifera]